MSTNSGFSVYDSVVYAIVRLSLWTFLATIGCADGFRNRHIRSKGWQLYLLLVIDACLFVVRNGFLLGVAITGTSRAMQFLYLIFSDVAESAWIFTLLAISSGFCITRCDFGEHKSVCILIPCIFLLTSVVVDFVLYLNTNANDSILDAEKPYDQVTPDDEYDPEKDPLATLDPDTGLVFVFCTLVNTMVFFMAWFYMYDTAKQEWDMLNDSILGDGGAKHAHLEEEEEEGRMGPRGYYGGHGIQEEEDDIPVYSSVENRDRDSLKTVEECVSDREKLVIMKRFFVGVSIYIVASVLVFFLPVFLPHIWEATLLSLYDVLLLVFIGALMFVFRMRQTNQFVLVSSGEEQQGLGLHGQYTTELGVM
jgi:cbb3-type cytochrome oxidase subunit 3